MIEYLPGQPWDKQAFTYRAPIGEITDFISETFDAELDHMFINSDVHLISFPDIHFNIDDMHSLCRRGFTPSFMQGTIGMLDDMRVWVLTRNQWKTQRESLKTLEETVEDLFEMEAEVSGV